MATNFSDSIKSVADLLASLFFSTSSLVKSTGFVSIAGGGTATTAGGGGGGDSIRSCDVSGINFSGLVRGDGFGVGFLIESRLGDGSDLDGIKSGFTMPVFPNGYFYNLSIIFEENTNYIPSVRFLLYSNSKACAAKIFKLRSPAKYLSHCAAVNVRIVRLTMSLRE